MANKGQTETAPYSQIVLSDKVTVATDTPLPISVRNDQTTGLFPSTSGGGSLAGASGGTKVFDFSSSGFTQMIWKTSAAFSAKGSSAGTANQIVSINTNVASADSSTGVILPAIATCGIGAEISIFNSGANPIKVYTSDSSTIDGTAGSTGVTLTNAKRCTYYSTSASTWISAQLGAVSG